MPHRDLVFGCLCLLSLGLATAAAAESEEPQRIDYLTFAQGAVNVSAESFGAKKPVNESLAMQLIDGDPRGFPLVSQVEPEGGAEIVYELPAPTTFDRFAVPEVHETPSPSQTFMRHVRVEGSAKGAGGPWTLLASGELKTHGARGQVSELEVVATVPVRWVKLRVWGGLEVLSELMFYEFGELIGNGKQETSALSLDFPGLWKGRGFLAQFRQEGPLVQGCIDLNGEPFEGTVSGRLLRGRSVDPKSGVVSLFILMVREDGGLQGVRSTNGAPFHLLTAEPAPAGSKAACAEPSEPALGCESIIHGITFDFDSAAIRPESEPVLQALFQGLQAEASARIVIEGHTSSEGSTDYNQGLSERRAAAVVADLVKRGVDAARIAPLGKGETEPIASNADESGRSLNRRVEVHCVAGA